MEKQIICSDNLNQRLALGKLIDKNNNYYLKRIITPNTQKHIENKHSLKIKNFRNFLQQKKLLIQKSSYNYNYSNFIQIKSQLKNNKNNPFYIKNYKRLSIIGFIKQLGKGSFGVVNKCINQDGQIFAIKTYLKSKLNFNTQKSIYNEIQILKKLDHPGIIKLYQSIQNHKAIHLILEYFEGTSVKEYIQSKNKLKQNQCKKFFKQVIDIMSYLHSNNIVHRDLKPQNILINNNLQIKLIDFGFAVHAIQFQNNLNLYCGTPSYMAPQIIWRKPYSGFCVDMWCLGILLFYFLHGKVPFVGQTESILYKKICSGIFKLNEKLSQGAKYLISKLLEKNACDRISIKQLRQNCWLEPINIKKKLENLKKQISIIKE